jgi:SNF2 family DNA or RNA helicase
VLEVLPGGSYSRKDCIISNQQFLSGKMRYLDLCLNMFKVNDRVLIFSYSTTTLTLIEQYVKSKGFSYLRLDGSTPTKQRQVGTVEKLWTTISVASNSHVLLCIVD